ncbi:MAG: A24 family peptidase [Candidatus Woesearchaeota archaeon]
MLLISIILAFLALLIASITDLKSREVPDYISYALVFVAFATSLANTIINWNYIYIVQSAMGFVIGLIIAYSMFYLGQWGGGDSKLMIGLGAIFGFNVFQLFGEKNYWLLIFLGCIILLGAVYGLIWSVFLAIKHRKAFVKGLDERMQRREILITRRTLLTIIVLMLLVIILILEREYQLPMLLFTAMLYVIFYLWVFVKVIEEKCMVKELPINKLTEGDWIHKDVYIGKKFITGPRDLGISREQIASLKKYSSQGKIKTVTVKEGIPFIPAFLMAFVATIMMYYSGMFRIF